MNDIPTESEQSTHGETAERDFVVAEDAAPARPEWLPEKYNSGEDLAKAYKELESKLGTKEEDLRAKFRKKSMILQEMLIDLHLLANMHYQTLLMMKKL